MSKYLYKIKQLNKITLTKICKELNIDRSNLLNDRTTKENEKKVYDEIVKQITNVIKEKE